MYFAKNVTHLMRKKGWRNKELAEAIKISPQQVGRYLNESNQPKMETLVDLARLFDVTVDDLILVDLSKSEGRKFGAGVESAKTTDDQLTLINRLLTERVLKLEQEMKKTDPDLARELGIE